jgi:hypothetical protein
VCAQFVALCRDMGLLTKASVAIDGSKFKAVNTRDKNFTKGKVERRRAQLEESVARYLAQLDTADLQDPSEALAAKTAHLKEKLAKLTSEMQRLEAYEKQMLASPDQQISLTDPDSRSMATSGRGSGVVGYNVQVAVRIITATAFLRSQGHERSLRSRPTHVSNGCAAKVGRFVLGFAVSVCNTRLCKNHAISSSAVQRR